MRQATLCFLIKENQSDRELLLAMKKRGFGVGKWNGVGGKLEPEKGDKDVVTAVIRETKEEIGVQIKELEKAAVLNFYFPYNQAWNQEVHVFLAKNWIGEPKESEEMLPKWFKDKEIPFEEMWDDDKFWLPHILKGKKLKADFVFKEGEKIAEQNIKFIKSFEV
jgi:8-oxo-dGTP pyrophosphatase MutT (NUDIX family)